MNSLFKYYSKESLDNNSVGYRCFAINYIIEDFGPYHGTKKKGAKPLQVTPPEQILLSSKELEEIKTSLGISYAVRQLSRVTIAITEVNHTNKVQTEETIRRFDLIAIQPETDKILQVTCQSLRVDIISLDLTQKLPYRVKRSTLGMATERGLVFEIQYSPMIRDSTLRRYVIANGVMLYDILKGKNLIITSGCQKAMELRGDRDVQNLSQLFGLSEVQAKNCNTVMCDRCVTHGETAGKRVSRCIVSVTKLPETQDSKDVEPPAKKLKTVDKT